MAIKDLLYISDQGCAFQLTTTKIVDTILIEGLKVVEVVHVIFKKHYFSEAILSLLPEYRGFPSFMSLLTGLRQQIYSMTQDKLTHTVLSEKNW